MASALEQFNNATGGYSAQLSNTRDFINNYDTQFFSDFRTKATNEILKKAGVINLTGEVSGGLGGAIVAGKFLKNKYFPKNDASPEGTPKGQRGTLEEAEGTDVGGGSAESVPLSELSSSTVEPEGAQSGGGGAEAEGEQGEFGFGDDEPQGEQGKFGFDDDDDAPAGADAGADSGFPDLPDVPSTTLSDIPSGAGGGASASSDVSNLGTSDTGGLNASDLTLPKPVIEDPLGAYLGDAPPIAPDVAPPVTAPAPAPVTAPDPSPSLSDSNAEDLDAGVEIDPADAVNALSGLMPEAGMATATATAEAGAVAGETAGASAETIGAVVGAGADAVATTAGTIGAGVGEALGAVTGALGPLGLLAGVGIGLYELFHHDPPPPKPKDPTFLTASTKGELVLPSFDSSTDTPAQNSAF